MPVWAAVVAGVPPGDAANPALPSTYVTPLSLIICIFSSACFRFLSAHQAAILDDRFSDLGFTCLLTWLFAVVESFEGTSGGLLWLRTDTTEGVEVFVLDGVGGGTLTGSA